MAEYPDIGEVVRGEGYTYWKGIKLGYTGTDVLFIPSYEVMPLYSEERGHTPFKWLYLGCIPMISVDIHSINDNSLDASFLEMPIGKDRYQTGRVISEDKEHIFEYKPKDSRNPSIYAKGFCLVEAPVMSSYNHITALYLKIRCSELRYG